MNIQSKIWDYYMTAQYILGQDPLLEFKIPNRLFEHNKDNIFHIPVLPDKLHIAPDYYLDDWLDSLISKHKTLRQYRWSLRTIVFCGRVFHVIRQESKTKFDYKDVFYHRASTPVYELYKQGVLSPHTFPELWDLIYDLKHKPETFYARNIPQFITPEIVPEMLGLSKQVGFPYFEIYRERSCDNKHSAISVNPQIINLAELKFETILSINKCYFEIEQFLANHLRECPDTKPPVTISDADNLVKKGFDLKTSFRRTKN